MTAGAALGRCQCRFGGPILDKMRETRVERLIAEELARRAQPALKLGDEIEAEDRPLVPDRPLEDVSLEQYAQDRAAMLNERLSERRTYVRDRHLAIAAKRKAGYRCQACEETLPDTATASRFVQAHHMTPISEVGPDVDTNLHRRHSSIVYRSPRDHELSVNAGALSA